MQHSQDVLLISQYKIKNTISSENSNIAIKSSTAILYIALTRHHTERMSWLSEPSNLLRLSVDYYKEIRIARAEIVK